MNYGILSVSYRYLFSFHVLKDFPSLLTLYFSYSSYSLKPPRIQNLAPWEHKILNITTPELGGGKNWPQNMSGKPKIMVKKIPPPFFQSYNKT